MTPNGNPGTALALLAGRLQVTESELQETLTQTVFKGANPAQMTALLVVANEYGLNPFTRELFAFPSKNGIVPVVSVDGWLRIINDHPQFAGMDIVYAETIVEVKGSRPCPEYIEVTIHRHDRPGTSTPIREYLDECYRGTEPWNTMTRRMLRHKAIKEAARVTMGLHGIFDQDEANDVLAREGKRIVPAGDVYDVVAVEEVAGEVIGEAEYTAMLSEVARVGISLSSVAKNVAAKAGYQGELTDMPLKVWESLMAGLAAMPTKNPPTPPSNEPTTATPEAPADAAAPEVVSTAVEAPNDADPAAFWPGEGAPHVGAPEGDDEGVPGRGPLFAVDDPNRPASGTDKRLLSEALAHVPSEWAKQYRQRFGGRSNSDLTHGEIAEFTAAAARAAVS